MLSNAIDKFLSGEGAIVYSGNPDQPPIDAMALMGQRRIAAVLVPIGDVARSSRVCSPGGSENGIKGKANL